MSDLVIIDTCIWAPYFQKRNPPVRPIVDQLLREDRVLIIGPIVFELLAGIKRTDHARWLSSELRSLNWSDLEWSDYVLAADLSRSLAKAGHALPFVDLQIAAVTQRTKSMVFTSDPHFDLIPDLPRFTP